MKRFVKTSFFNTLKETSQKGIYTDAKLLENGYDRFAMLLLSEGAAATDRAAYRDTLVYTRTELSSLTGIPEKNAETILCKAIELIDRQIAWMERLLLAERAAGQPPAKLKWTGSIIEWVELIYALFLAGRINGGKITLRELFRQMSGIFDFEVKEFSNYFMNIKTRTEKGQSSWT